MCSRVMFRFSFGFCLVLAGMTPLAMPTSIRAADQDVVKTLAPVIAKRALPLVDLILNGADNVTKVETCPKGTQIGGPKPGEALIVFPYDVRYKVEKTVKNRAFGKDVPGRFLTVIVETDCRVRLEMVLKDLVIRKDPDAKDTIEIILPEIKINAEIPENPNERFTANWGKAQPRDAKKESELRSSLVEQVKAMAKADFQNELNSTWRTELTDELKKMLQAKSSKTTFKIRQ